jgi:hypothetical protein
MNDYNYKYNSAEEAVNGTIPAKYICTANGVQTLPENQYFALLVTSDRYTPHTIAIQQDTHIVGIEKTSGKNGFYVSKNYFKRKTSERGVCVIIEILPENLDKFYILD